LLNPVLCIIAISCCPGVVKLCYSPLDFGVITFISANKLAEKAGWDKATLAVELSALASLLSKAELDVSLTVEI
jgi:hypothetical protein